MRAYVIAALVAVTAASTAPCQSAPTPAAGRGFLIGASAVVAPGLTVKGEDIEGEIKTKLGGGGGVQLGYEFSRGITAFGTFDLAVQQSDVEDVEGDFALVLIELGARYAFPLGSARVSPYVLAAFGQRALGATIEDQTGAETELALTGGFVDVGGGVQLPISRKLSFEGEVRVGFGKFGEVEIDDEKTDIDTDNTVSPRLRIGLSYYPTAR